MKRGGLISLTASGLYCKQGDFYIDPWKPVKKAVVTHAHAIMHTAVTADISSLKRESNSLASV
jgi:hypothetical protein